jgi:hypothetical protein
MEVLFTFFSLPKELRLMVYEQLHSTQVQYENSEQYHPPLNYINSFPRKTIHIRSLTKRIRKDKVHLIRYTVAVPLLSTCHLIYKEALPCLQYHFVDAKQHPPIRLTTALKPNSAVDVFIAEIVGLVRRIGLACSLCSDPTMYRIWSRLCYHEYSNIYTNELPRDEFNAYVMWRSIGHAEIAKWGGEQ